MSDKDAIYRQDAIDAINAYLGLSAVSRTIQNMTSIQEILENLPSAEPEHLVKESGDLVKDLVNDCISRQDAVKTMYDACEDIDHESLHIDVVVDALENLPSASPDLSTFSDKLWEIAYERGKKEGRKKGKWLRSGSAIFPCECDQCGDTTERNTPFCPHCGADMREGEEDG